MSGLPNDMKAIRAAAEQGDATGGAGGQDVYAEREEGDWIGFAALMGGLDAVVFAGGIGEHDARSRAEILEGLEGVGVSDGCCVE